MNDIDKSERLHNFAETLRFTPISGHQTHFITMKEYLGLYIQFVIAN